MVKQTVLITDTDLSDLIKSAVNSALKEHQAISKPDNTLLTQTQACELLKISVPTLIQWKVKGLLPFSQINRKIYFRKSDVLNAIEMQMSNKRKG